MRPKPQSRAVGLAIADLRQFKSVSEIMIRKQIEMFRLVRRQHVGHGVVV